MSLPTVSPIRLLIAALAVLPVLYVDFLTYRSGNSWLGVLILGLIALGLYIYLNPRAYTFRYLFPGLFAFALFVIFPLLYTVYISFTKYSSSHLLPYQSVVELLEQDSYIVPDTPSYDYLLYRQGSGKYVLLLTDQSNREQRFLSEPFDLQPGQTVHYPTVVNASTVEPNRSIDGESLKIGQITREGFFIPLRGYQFRLPNGQTVEKEGLDQFCCRTTGIGFRTFAGLDNYTKIAADPEIQLPFIRIFLWTVAFSAISAVGAFAIGMILAVVLEWKEMRLRKLYRTLLILPYAVPAVLSILIFKGLFNQEFGAVNALLHAVFGFAPQWETNPWGARAMVLLVNLWLGYPYMMLICTGMLQSIPSSIYEASAIEGSNPLTDFFQITLPLVFPPLLPVLIASFAFNFNNFSVIYLLTGGGPKMLGGGNAGETDILVSYTYTLAFRSSENNYALASAIATLLFFLVGTLAWINLRMSSRRIVY